MARAARGAEAPRETPDAILDAARRRYARFGPRKTTMEEVAREAGCSRATLYTHFPSKEALYGGLLERETRGFLAELDAAAASPASARHKLRRIVEAALGAYAGNPILLGALTGDDEMALERIAAPAVAHHERHVIERLASVLRDGISEGSFREVDAEAVAYLMFQLGHVLVTREVAGRGEFPLERIMAVMDDLVARGIQRREAPRRRRRHGRT